MMIVDMINHKTWLYDDDGRPFDPPKRERNYVRLKVTFQLKTATIQSERESVSLVPLRQFLADSQGIISGICSKINVQMPGPCIDIISEKARGLCRGALFVDRYRRLLPLQVDLSAVAPFGTLLDSTNALTPVAELREALATKDEREAPCSICLEAFGGSWIVRMPCSHSYHKLCVAKWLEKNHTCPLCRYSMTGH